MNHVNRDSPGDKVQGLMTASEDLIEEMEHNEKLAKATIKFTPKTLNILRDFSTFMSVTINFLLLTFRNLDYKEKSIYLKPEWIDNWITIIGLVQICTSSIVLLIYIYSKGTLIIGKKWRE
jgi:hypothetical protein